MYQDSPGSKTGRGASGVSSSPKLYRPNRNAADYCRSFEWQSSLHINCIDFEKAFDSRDLWWSLRCHYGLSVKIITIIRALYDGFSAQVVNNGQRLEPSKIRTGVRQGWLLSPCCVWLPLIG